MIKDLQRIDLKLAEKILSIQHPAYLIEAKLIDFQGIPALSETVEDILNSQETFIGYYEDDELLGILSYEITDDHVDICRLVVSPASFCKGIGRQLVTFVLENVRRGQDVVVSTGEKNIPAVELYAKLCFQQESLVEIAPGVQLVNLRFHNK